MRPHRILGDDSLRLLLRHSHECEPGGDIGGYEVEPLHTLKDVRKHPTNALQEPGVTSAAECTVAVQCMQSDGWRRATADAERRRMQYTHLEDVGDSLGAADGAAARELGTAAAQTHSTHSRTHAHIHMPHTCAHIHIHRGRGMERRRGRGRKANRKVVGKGQQHRQRH
jgi:hypothetical protein